MSSVKGRDPGTGERSAAPLTRPQVAEAHRLRAAELLAQGRSRAEVAEALGVTRESVRRWQAALRQGGVAALRRRVATGRPAKLTDAQAEAVKQALEAGAQACGFATQLWTLDRVVKVVQAATGVRLHAPACGGC